MAPPFPHQFPAAQICLATLTYLGSVLMYLVDMFGLCRELSLMPSLTAPLPLPSLAFGPQRRSWRIG